MSASGKSAGKGGGQNRSAGGLKTGGAVQPMPEDFIHSPESNVSAHGSNVSASTAHVSALYTASVYNPGERVLIG